MTLHKPYALKPGDTIGICSPSSPLPPEELESGVAAIQARGYRVVVSENALARHPHNSYLAGTDAQRAADLNALFARPDIDAIFCARGGYGAMRLFDLLDWPMIAANPKIVVGYSDLTSLHLGLTQAGGFVSFHAPMLSRLNHLEPEPHRVFWELLEKPEPFGILPTGAAPLQTIVSGTVEGELAGGCLSLLAHACGSRFMPDLRGKIVLIEDVGEGIYRIDRFLTQLKNAGALDEVAGFVLGHITKWQSHEADPPQNTPEALWHDFFAPLGKPTLCGFPFGHEPQPLSLPLGVRARLDADAGTLTLLESATC